MDTAVSLHWIPWCELWDIDPIIQSGDPDRGGIFASWFVDMVDDTVKNKGKGLRFSTVSGYAWAIREWIKKQGQLDPLEAVHDWEHFVSGVEIETWEESEPRKEIPFQRITAAVCSCDPECYMDCLFCTVFLMMFYTMNRSEYPVPKTADSFDNTQHTRWEDVKADDDSTLWGVGKIKQDRRRKRLGIIQGRKTTIVGDVKGSVMNLKLWLSRYLTKRGRGNDGDPFFIEEDGRTLTYGVLLSYMRKVFARFLSQDEADSYALHGVRVAGYNCARLGKDPELAQLQGDWCSAAFV